MADHPESGALTSLMQTAFESLESLCSSLGPDDWSRQTDCPGWTVQDQLAHQCGIESRLLGRPAPDHDVPGAKNPMTEVDVDYRRSWPPDKVLAEFREIVPLRLRALRERGMDAERFAIRIFDCWLHEQDIRCAVGKPGNLDGPVAAHVLSRCAMAMPMIVGKRAAAPDGTTVVFRVEDRAFPITVEGGRARMLDATPPSADVTMSMDAHTLTRLCGGRRIYEEVSVDVEGDADLARRILTQMTVTP